jgi:hypothetical protein
MLAKMLDAAALFRSGGGMKKAGRKRQHHTDSATGLPVVGLSKMSDGRWRVIGTHTRFTEPDEQRAIRRFYDLTDQRVRGTVAGIAVDARRSELLDLKDQLDRFIEANETAFWRRVADEIRESPKRVAKLTGIEEIGYLRDLEPPEDLPSLKELEDLWEAHAGVGPVERRKVLGF